MHYVEVSCRLQYFDQQIIDILIAELNELGFESFQETETGVNAYISQAKLNEEMLKLLPPRIADTRIEYASEIIKEKNWNELWEKDYAPVIVDNQCVIRAPFHYDLRKLNYEIIIEPKMSFGTGHHETTLLMVKMMLPFNFQGKHVLDIGCGTGILAILASKMGALSVVAADIDTWAYENTVENIEKNKCKNIETFRGGMDVLPDKQFDVVLANINRNILLNDMSKYADVLNPGGNIFFSGIYKNDMEKIVLEGKDNSMIYIDYIEKNNWVALQCVKKGDD